MSKEILEKILKNSEIIISLVGRSVFTEEEIRKIVTERKRTPQKYIDGYNACDGEHTITEIANIVGVSQPNMSGILPKWEELGIIYKVEKPNGTFYKKLYPI